MRIIHTYDEYLAGVGCLGSQFYPYQSVFWLIRANLFEIELTPTSTEPLINPYLAMHR